MAKRNTVLIYEVDDTGMSGPQVGEGTLIKPRGVLVHPPLSHEIRTGSVSKRLRVEIRSNNQETHPVELIDVKGDPHIIGENQGVGPLVGLELSTPSTSPVDRMTGVSRARTAEKFVTFAAPRLTSDDPRVWNHWSIFDFVFFSDIVCSMIPRWCDK